jgi:hypothetical protein
VKSRNITASERRAYALRLVGALRRVEAALQESESRSSISGLERLREDLRAELRSLEEGLPGN